MGAKIGTLLIANRGEIALRVIATARRLGIRTVAVFSDADENAAHVKAADGAVRIGPAPVSESYLRIDALLNAAQRSGADAVHPGYGFLSENPDFVDAVEDAGLTFIGPPASAIRAMGLKDAAKVAMEDAGVPVVPGYHGGDQTPDHLARMAEDIGYPVLIKARAGGGGKGMRLVENPTDFPEALASARREAEASFGDPAVLVEKFITSPRHIEIQVFADTHGNVVHLFERDCSLQRRHQKVIEEAPAPGMPEDVRAAMGRAAVEAARAIDYVGAGTVEFIVDGSGPLRKDGFWFMEMNTRLQVEHPVTEAITGLDLVEWQLRVAQGDSLPFHQRDLTINGHAFEARLYAEDAETGFLPSTGTLTHLSFPRCVSFARGSVRVDAGVQARDTITPHYDPMIAKVIVHGSDRTTALRSLSRALGQTRIAGVTTNLGFLKRLADHRRFVAGQVDTGLIARDMEILTAKTPERERLARHAAALAALGFPSSSDRQDPWDMLDGWRLWGSAVHTVALSRDDQRFDLRVEFLPDARFLVDGSEVSATPVENGLRLSCGETTVAFGVFTDAESVTVFDSGDTLRFERIDPLDRDDQAQASGDVVVSPMPGLVTALRVAKGDTVDAETPILVLEAMKMEHTLRAPRAGTIAEVLTTVGAQVQNGAILVRLDETHDD